MSRADASPDPELQAFADRVAPAGPRRWTPLAGGVSCAVWRLDVAGESFCLKRALPKLNVPDDWRAPVSRALHEYRWFETARALVPGSAPEPLAVDPQAGLLAIRFLPEADHVLWKRRLLAGNVDVGFAGDVGARLGTLHAATAGRADIAQRFATDEAFFALRLESYLLAAARRRRAVAASLGALVERTARTRLALVHGDVSPKNIMIGPAGPVFLDAETAWYGDPAFDLAFCLNHLLLKTLVVPDVEAALADSFLAFAEAYLARADWEGRAGLEGRAASLLPGLLLARVDGKSPVEYLTAESQRDIVRGIAEPLLLEPPGSLGAVLAAWRGACGAAKSRA